MLENILNRAITSTDGHKEVWIMHHSAILQTALVRTDVKGIHPYRSGNYPGALCCHNMSWR